MQEPNYVEALSKKLSLDKHQISQALKLLLEEENSVVFVARYRKEQTNNLDETQLRLILEEYKKEVALYELQLKALTTIESQGKLTPELKKSILSCKELKQVEEIFTPYKQKRKTKAMIAEEKGFLPIAKQVRRASSFFSSQKPFRKLFKRRNHFRSPRYSYSKICR